MTKAPFSDIRLRWGWWASSLPVAIAYLLLAAAPVFRWDTAYLPTTPTARRTLPPSLPIPSPPGATADPRPAPTRATPAAPPAARGPAAQAQPTPQASSQTVDGPPPATAAAPASPAPSTQSGANTATELPNLQALARPPVRVPHTPLPEATLGSFSPELGDRLALLPPSTWVPPQPTLPDGQGAAIATIPSLPGGSVAPLPPAAVATDPPARREGGSAGTPTDPNPTPPAIATRPAPPEANPAPPAAAPPSNPAPPAAAPPSSSAPPPVPPPSLPPRNQRPQPRPSPAPSPSGPLVPSEPLTPRPDGEAVPSPQEGSPGDREPEGIFVEQFQVVGSTVFNQQQLAAAALGTLGLDPQAAPGTAVPADAASDQAPTVTIPIGRHLTLAQLVQAADAITQLYLDGGYISSGAVVLESSATSDQPIIQIIEGQLEDTLVTIVAPQPSLTLQRIPDGVRSPAPIPWQPLSVLETGPPEVTDADLVAVDLNLLAADSQADRLGGDLSIAVADTVRTDPYAALALAPGETPVTQAVPLPEIPLVAGSQLDPQTEQWRQWLRPEVGTRWLELTGLKPLDPGYVAARLEIAGGVPLNLNDLVEGVQLLQINPLIDRIATDISAGNRTGTSRLQVVVTQADSDQFQFSYDNSRSLATGSLRQGAQFSQGNLLGWGDRLQLAYGRTQGSEDWDIFYEVPISPYNTTVSLNVGQTTSEIIDEIFSQLDLVSQAQYTNLGIRQPIVQSPLNELALSLTLSHTVTRSTFLGGVPFPTDGADDEGFTRVTALRFGQEWLQRGEAQVIALQSEFSLGLDTLGATINDEPPDSRFFSWQGRAQWARLLGPDFLLLVRGSLQLADRPLPPTEQISTGGVSTVRGYRQNTLVTDNGWSASAELQIPVLRVPELEGLFQIAPFVDMGGGWYHPLSDNDPPEVSRLSSLGLGFIWTQGDYLRARLDWGIPLTVVESDGNSLQESGLHFSIILTPP